jgi:hypothetical protein
MNSNTMAEQAGNPSMLAQHLAPYAGAFLRGVTTLAEVLPGLPADTLLHAGPPYGDNALPAAVRNAAIHALVYEGLVADAGEAGRLIDSGRLHFAPAQDYGVVTPLAQVLTRSMPVLHVGDADGVAYAPLAEGPPPALRFGSSDPDCVARTHRCAEMALRELGPWLEAHPVPIDTVVRSALLAGDDCHTRTGAANRALTDALQGMPDGGLDAIRVNPGFVLTVLMAASAWALRRLSAKRPQTIVAAGGNGVRFGVRFAHSSAWQSAPAEAPVGPRFSHAEQARALGAIGDSAVIDMCGLGGQALAWSPELVVEWLEYLPEDWAVRRGAILDPELGGVDATRVTLTGCPPAVHLAMLDAEGRIGLLGRGFYHPPISLFTPHPQIGDA